MKVAAFALSTSGRFKLAKKLARVGQWFWEHDGELHDLPGMLAAWSSVRDLKAVPDESFREWWELRKQENPD